MCQHVDGSVWRRGYLQEHGRPRQMPSMEFQPCQLSSSCWDYVQLGKGSRVWWLRSQMRLWDPLCSWGRGPGSGGWDLRWGSDESPCIFIAVTNTCRKTASLREDAFSSVPAWARAVRPSRRGSHSSSSRRCSVTLCPESESVKDEWRGSALSPSYPV